MICERKHHNSDKIGRIRSPLSPLETRKEGRRTTHSARTEVVFQTLRLRLAIILPPAVNYHRYGPLNLLLISPINHAAPGSNRPKYKLGPFQRWELCVVSEENLYLSYLFIAPKFGQYRSVLQISKTPSWKTLFSKSLFCFRVRPVPSLRPSGFRVFWWVDGNFLLRCPRS